MSGTWVWRAFARSASDWADGSAVEVMTAIPARTAASGRANLIDGPF
jgi:hypothetical protein